MTNAVFLALLILLAASTGASRLHLGAAAAPVAIAIAVLKAGLIGFFYMKLRSAPKGPLVAVAAAGLWIVLLFALTAADYFTRDAFGVLGK